MHTTHILLFVLAALYSTIANCQDIAEDIAACPRIVTEYFARQTPSPPIHNPEDRVVFFLHVPRTAGRTYNSCFLKQAFAPSQRCARSYDMLRYNVSLPTCKLLTSHDDYSIVSTLPPDAVVITQLRDPVDRVLSAYEFANEVAVRGVGRQPVNLVAPTPKPGRTDTRNVWPWSHLVLWTQRILEEKAAKADARDHNITYSDNLDPYNNPLTLPLKQFIEQPIVHELLHDGATLQVLGITNYSIDPQAALVRHCYRNSHTARKELLGFAEERVRNFTHVGATDRLYDSIVSLAGSLHFSMFGPSWRSGAADAVEYMLNDDEPLPSLGVGLEPEELQRVVQELRTKRAEFGTLKAKLRAVVQRKDRDTEAMVQVQKQLRRHMSDLQVEGELLANRLGINWDGILPARAKQVKPDSEYQNKIPLWRAFRECEERTKQKQKNMKGKAFGHHKLPDGRSFTYSKTKRERIPLEIIQRIRELNPADTYLHQVGLTLLDANIQALRAANRLEALPTLEDIQRARAARQAKRRAAGERQLLEGEEEGKEERKEEGKEVSMFDGTGGGEVVKRRRKKLARK